MKNRIRFRLQLVGVTVGVLAALLIWPASRWIVGAQFGCLVPGRPSGFTWAGGVAGVSLTDWDVEARATHQGSVTLPDDLSIQVADAVTAPPTGTLSSDVKVARLRSLATRFSDRPSIYANMMRFATLGKVIVHREELNLMDSSGSVHPERAHRQSAPDALAAFDQDAAEGERLDPDNAFFPLLRAAGLFEAHRDSEALAAIHRAAQRPLWIEYYVDELHGKWQLQDKAFGENGAIPRIAIGAATLFPHYSQIRAASQMAVVKAMLAEQAGQLEQGIAIREDLMRCGGLMRTEAPSLIGNLVGSAVALTALQRPAGAALIPAPRADNSHITSVQVRERLVAQYESFLRRAGHSEQSARAHGEAEAATKIREVAHRNLGGDAFFGPSLGRLGLSWWVGVLLLCAAFWTLVLGVTAAIAYRSRQLRAGVGLPGWMGRGAALGTIAALLAGIIRVTTPAPAPILWLASAMLLALVALVFPSADRAERIRTLAAYVVGFAVTGACILLFASHIIGAAEPIRRVALYLYVMATQSEQSTKQSFPLFTMGASSDILYHIITVLIVATVPLTAALCFAIVSRVCRVPLSVALVRGFRGCAAPIACGLILAYAALLPVTMRLESVEDNAIRETVHHEGRFLAGLDGKEWPGRIP